MKAFSINTFNQAKLNRWRMALDTIHKKILHDHCLTRAELEEHRKNINLLTWQINNAVQFLDDLENNPKNLVKNKYHKLKKQF